MSKRATSLPRYLSGMAFPLAFTGITALSWGIRAIRRFAGGVDQNTELTAPILLRELILPHTVLVLGMLLLTYSIILFARLAQHFLQTHRRNLYRKESTVRDNDQDDIVDIDIPDSSANDSRIHKDAGSGSTGDELSQSDAEKLFEELIAEVSDRDFSQNQSPPLKH